MLELQATLIAFIEVKSQLAQRSGCKRLFSAKTPGASHLARKAQSLGILIALRAAFSIVITTNCSH